MNDWKTHFEDAINKARVLPIFDALLGQVNTPVKLTRLIQRYSIFASNFAGAAATLVGAFHIRQDLFRDEAEKIASCGDRGAEIASCVFAAVDDEYLDRNTLERVTHRGLSQRLLRNMAAFYKFDAGRFDKAFPLPPAMTAIMSEVLSAFRINRMITEDDLFYALGFHVANEIFADNEFQMMNRLFTTNYAELVKYLKERNAYGWIAAHNAVEIDHVNCGCVGIGRALQYYAGTKPSDEMRRRVTDGLDFAIDLELRVYSNLIRPADSLDRLATAAA